MKINELLDCILLESPPLPPDWDQSMFTGRQGTYKQMIEYAKARAQQIGKGSSRVAFEVPYQGRKSVLKVALSNTKGLSQNEEESELFSDWYIRNIGIVIPLIDYDERNPKPTWIHTEYADKITKAQLKRFFGGIDINDILASVEYQKTGRKNWRYKELPPEIHENENYQNLVDLVVNFPRIETGDLGRTANWGIYKGKPVILDLGFTENTISLYQRR